MISVKLLRALVFQKGLSPKDCILRLPASAMTGEQRDGSKQRQSSQHRQENFHPTLGIAAGDGSRVAVDDDLVNLRAVVVGQQPDRHEYMFESLAGIIILNVQISVSVAWHLRGAQGIHLAI